MATTSISFTVLFKEGRKLSVKATPMTVLHHIIEAICDEQQFSDPENYGLMNGDELLDRFLSIHEADVALGAVLELTITHKDPVETINLKLQLEDGTIMAQSFDLSTSLWDVLLGFERSSSGSINLTRRTGLATDSEVYMQPIVAVSGQEYTSIRGLKTTSLERAGLSANDNLLRIEMRHGTQGIDHFLAEIDKPFSSTLSTFSSPLLVQDPLAVVHPVQSRKCTLPLVETIPPMSGRYGSIATTFRDGHLVGPNNGSNNNNNNNNNNDGNTGNGPGNEGNGLEGDAPRQTPAQDISSAMLEANQEIRQLREQQTQEAMTDRVKHLSRTSDNTTDKDRFVRSMQFEHQENMQQIDAMTSVEERIAGERASSSLIATAPSLPSPGQASYSVKREQIQPHQELVRQIAHRVSQQLREAYQRGDSDTMANYHTLIAQEIVKVQRAGALPISPSDSRKNSIHANEQENADV